MKYMDLASATGRVRHRMLTRLHDSGLGKYLVINDEEFLEELDSLTDTHLSVGHSVIKAPASVTGGAALNPVGNIELETPIDVYSVIRVSFATGAENDPRDFQIVVVPDERLELIAYTTTRGVDGSIRGIDVQIDNPPNKGMATSVPVDSGQLVNPPQGASGMPTGAVIGLRAFDKTAHPVGNPVGIARSEIPRGLDQRVEDPASIFWRILLGLTDNDLIHQPIESGTQKVQPFSENHRESGWDRRGRMQVEGTTLMVAYKPLLNRVRLQMFSTEIPEFVSVRSCALYSGKKSPEFIVTHKENRNGEEKLPGKRSHRHIGKAPCGTRRGQEIPRKEKQ